MGPRRLAVTLRTVSQHRRFPLALGLFAIVLMLPSLGSGLFHDDLVHRAHLLKDSELPPRYYGTPLVPEDSGTLSGAMRDMFAVTRSGQDVRLLMEQGLFPWWTWDRLRLSNWRPLTALTHWLDYRLFPDTPALMHLHNVLWFALVVVLVAGFYRRMMAVTWLASLAAFLYVIDESNWFPVQWVANRNLLMALCFSLLTLGCHDRWRREADRRCAVAAPVCLLLALLSTEAGIATFAYLFAYALVIDPGSKRQRVMSLVPAMLVIVGWRIVYSTLGHGASGGGFVMDPGREPLAYLMAVLERAPVLLAGQWAWLPAETYWVFSEAAQQRYLLYVNAFLIVVLVVLLPLLRKDRVSLFWFIAMMLCVLPICATAPMNRNLLFVAIGAFGLTARYVAGVLGREDWVPRSRVLRVPIWIICITLLLIHIPLSVTGRAMSKRMMAGATRAIQGSIQIPDAADLPEKTVVVINAPNPFLFIGLPHVRSYEGKTTPRLARVLVPGWRSLDVSRPAERTLVVRAKQGNLLSVNESREDMRPNFLYLFRTFNTLFRGPNELFCPGQRIELPDLCAEVLRVDRRGFPTEVKFDFAVPLEDVSLRWLQWSWKPNGFGSYHPFTIPAPGQTVELAGPF